MDISENPVCWEDIAGLEHAKKTIKEIIVWPMLRPYNSSLFLIIFISDIFHGLRGPPKGKFVAILVNK